MLQLRSLPRGVCVTAAGSLWLGPVHSEARAGYQRARNAGLSPLRALVIGTVASFKECWTFRRNIAAKVGCSVRTVQRALTQARSEGLIGVARAKKTEVPPNWEHGPVTCGWSHRWVIGWGKAGQAVADAVHQAKARWLVKHAIRSTVPALGRTPYAGAHSATPDKSHHAAAGESGPGRRGIARERPNPNQRRTWTAAELDAELERLAAEKPPPS